MVFCLHRLGVSDAEIMKMGGWKTDHVMKTVYRHALGEKETARKISKAYSEIIGKPLVYIKSV